MKNDEEVQQAGRNILEGVAPERKEELEQLWTRYSPRFGLVDDAGDEGLFVLQGGLYREVWFNHRAMRAFWLASFIAWEGYRAISESANDESIELTRFRAMIDCLRRVLTEEDPEGVALPQGVPEPGVYPDAKEHPQERATAELATFATGWAFLHEFRHLRHQQEGTGAGPDATPEKCHAEEFSCDAYATGFLLESIDAYAAREQVSSSTVRLKREIGIYFALFAMALIGRDKWGRSDSHPALQERINNVMECMGSNGTHVSDIIAHGAFGALWMVMPEVPGPFRRFAR